MILAVNLQVSFLLFESQREHLKFQLEHYLTKLMEIVSSDSNRISYEQRELALGKLINLNLIMRYMMRDIAQYYKCYFHNLQRLY
jgi:hypothetical protein